MRGHRYELLQLIIQGRINGKRGFGHRRDCWLENLRAWSGKTSPELFHSLLVANLRIGDGLWRRRRRLFSADLIHIGFWLNILLNVNIFRISRDPKLRKWWLHSIKYCSTLRLYVEDFAFSRITTFNSSLINGLKFFKIFKQLSWEKKLQTLKLQGNPKVLYGLLDCNIRLFHYRIQ